MPDQRINGYWIIPEKLIDIIESKFVSGPTQYYLDLHTFATKPFKRLFPELFQSLDVSWIQDKKVRSAMNRTPPIGIFIKRNKVILDLFCAFANYDPDYPNNKPLLWKDTLEQLDLNEKNIYFRKKGILDKETFTKWKGNGFENWDTENRVTPEVIKSNDDFSIETRNIDDLVENDNHVSLRELIKFIEDRIDELERHRLKLQFQEKQIDIENLELRLTQLDIESANQSSQESYYEEAVVNDNDVEKNVKFLTTEQAINICHLKMDNPESDLISIQYISNKAEICEFKKLINNEDVECGHYGIWIAEYRTNGSNVIDLFIISGSVIVGKINRTVDRMEFIEIIKTIKKVDFECVSPEIAQINAINYAKRIGLLNGLLEGEYSVSTLFSSQVPYSDFSIGSLGWTFTWSIGIFDSKQNHLFTKVYINPENGCITLPYPDIKTDDYLDFFVDSLLEEMGYIRNDSEIVPEIKKTIIEIMGYKLSLSLFKNLTNELFEEFLGIETGNTEETDSFFDRCIPNNKELIWLELHSIREKYLGL